MAQRRFFNGAQVEIGLLSVEPLATDVAVSVIAISAIMESSSITSSADVSISSIDIASSVPSIVIDTQANVVISQTVELIVTLYSETIAIDSNVAVSPDIIDLQSTVSSSSITASAGIDTETTAIEVTISTIGISIANTVDVIDLVTSIDIPEITSSTQVTPANISVIMTANIPSVVVDTIVEVEAIDLISTILQTGVGISFTAENIITIAQVYDVSIDTITGPNVSTDIELDLNIWPVEIITDTNVFISETLDIILTLPLVDILLIGPRKIIGKVMASGSSDFDLNDDFETQSIGSYETVSKPAAVSGFEERSKVAATVVSGFEGRSKPPTTAASSFEARSKPPTSAISGFERQKRPST